MNEKQKALSLYEEAYNIKRLTHGNAAPGTIKAKADLEALRTSLQDNNTK